MKAATKWRSDTARKKCNLHDVLAAVLSRHTAMAIPKALTPTSLPVPRACSVAATRFVRCFCSKPKAVCALCLRTAATHAGWIPVSAQSARQEFSGNLNWAGRRRRRFPACFGPRADICIAGVVLTTPCEMASWLVPQQVSVCPWMQLLAVTALPFRRTVLSSCSKKSKRLRSISAALLHTEALAVYG